MIAPRIAIPGSTVVRGIGCQGRRAADADQVAYNAGSRLAQVRTIRPGLRRLLSDPGTRCRGRRCFREWLSWERS